MPEQIVGQEFRDEYQFTRYPFMDTATLRSTQTQQVIEHDLFIDASVYIVGLKDKAVFIREILVTASRITIVVGAVRGVADVQGSFDPQAPPANVSLFDSWGRPAGILVSDAEKLARFGAWQLGSHLFGAIAATFVPSCVIPMPEVGVRGIALADGTVFTKDVTILGENGVVVRQDGPEVIRVDIVGDPLFRRQLCTPLELFSAPQFIKTINGCPPDADGNFQITIGDNFNEETIIRLNRAGNNLVIEAVGGNPNG